MGFNAVLRCVTVLMRGGLLYYRFVIVIKASGIDGHYPISQNAYETLARATRRANHTRPLRSLLFSPASQGMNLISSQDAAGFDRYLAEHANTICGRHPIAVSWSF